jgi:hypothetical protein
MGRYVPPFPHSPTPPLAHSSFHPFSLPSVAMSRRLLYPYVVIVVLVVVLLIFG